MSDFISPTSPTYSPVQNEEIEILPYRPTIRLQLLSPIQRESTAEEDSDSEGTTQTQEMSNDSQWDEENLTENEETVKEVSI